MVVDMEDDRTEPKTRRGKIVKFIWSYLPYLFLFIMIALIVMLGGMIDSKKTRLAEEKKAALTQERKPVNAVLLTVTPTVIRDRINLPGIIEPWTDLELLAKINGTVEEVLVREGDTLKKGQTIARIEDKDYRIVLNGAEAAYNLAVATLKRHTTLHAKGLIPTAELDVARTEMETTRAALEDARLNLSRCSVTVPMAGVVEHLDLKVGFYLSVGDPMARILEVDRVKAVIGIPESDVAAVSRLNRVQLTIQALGDRVVDGTRYFLDASPDTAARLYRLELALDNRDHAILPGMFVRADLVKETAENSIAVPLYSVVARNDEQYVFLAQEGKAYKRPVTIGIMEGWQVQVREGLDFGDQVIIEGHREVEDGQQINVVRIIDDPGELP
jgi:membrane fusion protein (multidrug efflux system)